MNYTTGYLLVGKEGLSIVIMQGQVDLMIPWLLLGNPSCIYQMPSLHSSPITPAGTTSPAKRIKEKEKEKKGIHYFPCFEADISTVKS